MKNHKLILALCLLQSIGNLFAMPIYDGDDRILSTESSPDRQILAEAVAARISQYVIDKNGDDFRINEKLASQHKFVINGEDPKTYLCEDEKFGNLPVPSTCTGFLVGEDLLLTAGHCVKDKFACEKNRWVFGFEDKGEDTLNIPNQNLYYCKKVLDREENSATKVDYALIQLDRPVEGRRPLKLRSEGTVNCRDELMVMGHPYGLPLIIADNGYAHCDKIRKDNFYASLDSFAGNSGSPVINVQTGLVEGILTTGKDDYVLDSKNKCYRPMQYTADGAGEGVVKLPSIYLNIKKYLR